MSNLDRTPVLVRVDSTKAIGCGHVMRCIALAQGLRRAGHLVHFVGRIDSESLKARLDCEGIPFTSIESMHPSPDDLEKTIHILQSEKKPKGGWVVLDGYHFNFEYQSALRSLGYRVLLLDDNAHQPKYNVDILLNQNVTAGSFEYRTNDDAMRLFGPQYVLLREEFLGLKSARREIGKIKSLLVSIGGSDPKDVTGLVAEALFQLEPGEWEVVFVLGPSYMYETRLKKRLLEFPHKNKVLSSVSNMGALMESADLAIAASGTTSWELSYLGVPTIYCAWADNQIEIGRWLANEGAAINLGLSDDLSADDIVSCLKEMIANVDSRRRISQVSQAIVDGKGAERVIESMLSFGDPTW